MPGAGGEEATRLRKPRFSYEENQILIREVRAHYARLYGAHSRRVTVAERRRVWEGIAAKINGLTSWKRTGQEVQKRWNDFKRRTKEKLARVPHSTQGAPPPGIANAPSASAPTGVDESFSAEEETIFAILGPGVGRGAGAEPASAAGRGTTTTTTMPSPLPPAGFGGAHGYRLAAERGTDISANGHASSCSPETSSGHRMPCCPLDGALLRPKERDSPAPPSDQASSLQIVQLAPSPLASLGCGPRLEHSPAEQLLGAAPCPSTSPLARRRRTCFDPAAEAPLDFLQAQRETAEAIRELTYTLRQGLERLTDIVAALLPLLPAQTNGPLPPQEGASPPPPPPPPPPPSSETLHPGDTLTTKVEPSLEKGEAEVRSQGEEGPPVAETRAPPPHRGRKGIPTRKRRGRWKNS